MVRDDTIEQARNLAAERGVSERTVWRWFAAMRAADSLELLERERICECCERDLPAHSTIRRRYCDGTCRVNAHRARRTGRSRPRRQRGHRRFPRSSRPDQPLLVLAYRSRGARSSSSQARS